MANLTRHLTSISPDLRSGPPPGRRLLAAVLCGGLLLGATFPGFAVAGEGDSEGEGTATPVEVPLGPPDFDPGGEETDLEEEAPDEGEEAAVVEAEAEAEVDTPAPQDVSGPAPEGPIEVTAPPQQIEVPDTTAYVPAEEPVEQQASEAREPVANMTIVAPNQHQTRRSPTSESTVPAESAPPTEPVPEEAPPSSPQPIASTPPDSGRSLAGKDTYVVRPGDCLWYIAEALLPAGAGTQAIEAEVERLWWLNEDRIGTGDPSLIYAGTELRLG